MCLPVFTAMIKTLTFKKENMYQKSREGFMNATDAADYLVRKNIPFRDAHEIIGKLVLYAASNKKALDDLTVDEFRNISDKFDEDIFECIKPETCVNKRIVEGGPSKTYIEKLIAFNEKYLNEVK